MRSVFLYEPVRYHLEKVEETLRESSRVEGFPLLAEVLSHILDWPGKHLRPVVTLLSSEFHPHSPEIIVRMATAVEMLHIATLVHDDTVDQAHVRRGRATVSKLWGKDIAVLVGDYVFAKSATLACDTGNIRVMRLFAETVMAMSAGELRELAATYRPDQTREQYWMRIRDKTASLFATAAETGAILSGAPERHVQALRSFGLKLGMAFQIVDDILDFQGSEEVVGKPVGNDLFQGVMTLPAILLSERCPNENAIRAAFDDRRDPAKVRAAVELIRDSSIIEESTRIALGFCREALEALQELPDVPARRSLEELTDYVTRRQK